MKSFRWPNVPGPTVAGCLSARGLHPERIEKADRVALSRQGDLMAHCNPHEKRSRPCFALP